MIVSRLIGGMGNQMFQYALARHLSIQKNTSLKLDLKALLDRTPRENFVFRDYDLDIFTLEVDKTADSDFPEFNLDGKPRTFIQKLMNRLNPHLVYNEKGQEFDPAVLQLPQSNIYLAGYWQSEKYFREIADVIRKDFTIRPEHIARVAEMAEEIRSANSVCLNVRRADYVSNPVAAQFHGVISTEWYAKAIEIMKEKVGDIHIYVTSDDVEWCEENLKFDVPTTFLRHDPYKGHKFSSYLYLMTQCKHFIIPNSSFAWWAAWLSPNQDNVVVAPQRWFLAENVNSQDILPERWIKL